MADQTWIVIADDMSVASVVAAGSAAGLPVKALVFGDENRAKNVSQYGLDSVLWFETTQVLAEEYIENIATLARDEDPAVILCADEPIARTIVGGLAARIGAATLSSISSVIVNGVTTVEHYVANGDMLEVVEYDGPVAGCLADGGAEAVQGNETTIEHFGLPAETTMKVVATNVESNSAASLVVAERVVGCGLGVGTKENLELISSLAQVLKAEVACSLPLCDNYHWFEHSSVVGTSTQKISPRLYLACGVSGVPQHVMGVRGAKTICAINSDPDAPIFKVSSFGVCGDLKEVIPALLQAIKEL